MIDVSKLAEILNLQRVSGNSNKITASCPFTGNHKNGDKNPSFQMKNDGKGSYICYGCGVHGQLYFLCKDLGNEKGMEYCDSANGFESNTQHSDRPVIPSHVFNKARTLSEPPKETSKNMELFESWTQNHPEYIHKNRGISLETCKRLHIGQDNIGYERLSKKGDKIINFGPRGIFLVKDVNNTTVGWSGRLISNEKTKFPPRYYHWEGMDKSEYLYNECNIDWSIRYGIVFEGQMSVARWVDFGFKNCLATMGAFPSEAQMRKLKSWFEFLIYVPDNDNAGLKASATFKEEFGKNVVIIKNDLLFDNGEPKDPSDFTRQEAINYSLKCKKVIDYYKL